MSENEENTISRRGLIGMGAAAGIAAASSALAGGGRGLAFAEPASVSASGSEAAYDLLIKGGNVFGAEGPLDVAVKDGVIAAVGELGAGDAAEVIDADGLLVSPSFCDTHTHLDKAFQMEYPEYRDKVRELEAEYYAGDEVDYGYPVCGGSESYLMGLLKESNDEDGLREVIRTRISRACDMAIANGTGLIKTNNTWGPLSVEVVEGLKQEYAGKIDLKNIVIYTDNAEEGDSCTMTAAALEEYCASGAVDFLGGYFDGDYGYEDIDGLFELASKHGLPIDVHVLETDVPLLKPFDYFLDKTIEYGMEGKVTFGHLTALDAPGIDEDELAAVIEKAAKAQANVTSLVSCNMYLMGRKAANPVRRGPTRLKQLMAAGVNCCYASDNIRDAWRPYGNADMMQEAMVAAHCMQYAFPDELETVWKMGTYNAAKNALVEGYGVEEGCNADLVVLDAPNADLALIGQAKKLYVVKGGKVVAKDGVLL